MGKSEDREKNDAVLNMLLKTLNGKDGGGGGDFDQAAVRSWRRFAEGIKRVKRPDTFKRFVQCLKVYYKVS